MQPLAAPFGVELHKGRFHDDDVDFLMRFLYCDGVKVRRPVLRGADAALSV